MGVASQTSDQSPDLSPAVKSAVPIRDIRTAYRFELSAAPIAEINHKYFTLPWAAIILYVTT
jgi:hypothetical protein